MSSDIPKELDACFCFVHDQEWFEVLKSLKPGAHLIVINTSPREVCRIEEWGFEIRDTIFWISSEKRTPILLAMKPKEGTYVENALEYGVSGLNIDGSRITLQDNEPHMRPNARNHHKTHSNEIYSGVWNPKASKCTSDLGYHNSKGRFPANLILQHTPECVCDGMKKVKASGGPVKGGSGYAKGGYEHGQRDIRPEFSGYASEDGTEEVANWNCTPECPVRQLDEQSGVLTSGSRKAGKYQMMGDGIIYGTAETYTMPALDGDSGGASRFFYNAVSDEDLYIYLARLILPPKRDTPRRILTSPELQDPAKAAGWETIEVIQ